MTVCANPQLLHNEEEHIKGALQRCKYSICMLNRFKIQRNHKYNTTQANNNTNNNDYNNIHMVLPYTKDLSECFKIICGKMGGQVIFKGSNTIRSLLMAPKDKDNITQKSGVIYRYRFDRYKCD